MKPQEVQALVTVAVAVLLGAALAAAGSAGGLSWHGWPVFALCGLVAYALQWVVFVPSYLARTEHWFDLTGALTYLTLAGFALWAGHGDARALLLAALVGLWALRLGAFLFLRVKQDGADRRFDSLKHSFPRFLMTWTLQGLWVYVTLAAALAALTGPVAVPLGPLAAAGAVLWAVGFAVEVVADAQKRAFRRDAANAGRFISTGLWAWSRHPNYAGEIVLWTGIALIAAEALSGWRWITLVSPLFVYALLTRVSGIPMLEARGRQRWGDEPAYQVYVKRTPVLWPRPPRAG